MSEVFVDTGAWFARFVPADPDHAIAREWFERDRRPLITTDYIVDELLTLLKVRGEYQRALVVGPLFLSGDLCDVEWVTPVDVHDAWNIYSTYQDKGWSFTDCTSLCIMRRLNLTTAVAFDEHFRQFGAIIVVP